MVGVGEANVGDAPVGIEQRRIENDLLAVNVSSVGLNLLGSFESDAVYVLADDKFLGHYTVFHHVEGILCESVANGHAEHQEQKEDIFFHNRK